MGKTRSAVSLSGGSVLVEFQFGEEEAEEGEGEEGEGEEAEGEQVEGEGVPRTFCDVTASGLRENAGEFPTLNLFDPEHTELLQDKFEMGEDFMFYVKLPKDRYMPSNFRIYRADAMDMVKTFYAAIKEPVSAAAPAADD